MHARELPLAYRCPRSTADFVHERPGLAWCPSCREPVHELALLGEAATRRLLSSRAGAAVCVRYRVDAEGRVCFEPPPLAPTRLARRPRVRGFALAALTSTLLAGCVGSPVAPMPLAPPDDAWSQPLEPEARVLMGMVIVVEPGRSGDVDDSLIEPIDDRQIVPDQLRERR
jgi:hypothetical protein